MKEHDPLSDEPVLLSAEKRAWCASPWEKRGRRQPRLAVFQFAMNSTPRPTAPEETISYGYMKLNKFHDREPEAVLAAIDAVDPEFFDSWPRKATTALSSPSEWSAFKKGAVGELARAYYRLGLAAYGKPKLRRPKDAPPGEPLATI